jgi:dTDP-4-dehydrorhamnose reductase
MEPLLLIGANGQLGWELQRCLAPLGTLVATARNSSRALDVTDVDAIRRLIREIRPACIVNASAYTAVDRAEQESDLAHAVNAVAPGILAEEARTLGIPLIHYSTDYVFPGTSSTAYVEADATDACGVYGASKLAGEQAVRDAAGAYLVLRTSWVYGLRGRNFLRTMLRVGAERSELQVVNDQTASPNWSRLLAQGTAQLLACCGENLRDMAEVYHLSSSGETTWHGFAQAIFDEYRALAGASVNSPRIVPISTADYAAPAPRPAYSTLSAARLNAELGVKLPPWRESLRLCLADELAGSAATLGTTR